MKIIMSVEMLVTIVGALVALLPTGAVKPLGVAGFGAGVLALLVNF